MNDNEMYIVQLCESFTERVMAESKPMPYADAVKTKEYLDSLFPGRDLYTHIRFSLWYSHQED